MPFPYTAKLIFHFVVHMLVAAVLFGCVTMAAYALWLFTEWLRSLGARYEIWIVSYAVSELVFWLDVFCFIVFTTAEAWVLIREIIDSARRSGPSR